MPRRFLFTALIGFCGGIILAGFWRVPIIVLGAVTSVALLCFSWRRFRLPATILLALALGILRFTLAAAPSSDSVARFDDQQLQVSGQIFELPDTGDRQVVLLDQLTVLKRPADGKLQVYLPSWPKYEPGQELKVDCKIVGLSATKYARQWSHGIQARCFSAKVVSARDSPPSARRWLARLLNIVVKKISQNYNQPQSSLLAGILLGSQSAMPDELRQEFQATGTTHIVALSGFNVTIIVTAMLQLLVRFIGRKWAWLPGLVAVIVFVIMTGASASVVRAAIMAVITQLGLFLGRPIAPGRLLSYAALIMLWHNPLILVNDLGFQLSFLATVGLVFFSKPLATRIQFIPEFFGLRESLSTTLAAIMITEPLLLWRFGRLSLIAPLVNILVLPLIPIIMGIGTLWLVGQFIHPLLGMVLQPITDVLLRLALWLISSGAATPLSQVYLGGWIAALTVAGFIAIAVSMRKQYDPEADPA